MNRNLFRTCTTIAGLALLASCNDSATTAPPQTGIAAGSPDFSATIPFNDEGACLAADAYNSGFTTGVNSVTTLADPTKSCTSNDVRVARADIVEFSFNGTDYTPYTGQQVTCVENSPLFVRVAAHLEETATSARSDIGIWVGLNGSNGRTGTCNHYNLVAPANGTTSGGVSNIDGDQCGDMNAGAETDPPVPLGVIDAVCQGTAGSDLVHVGSCLAWTVPGSDQVCPQTGVTGPNGFRFGTTPSAKSKCNCSGFDLPITIVRPPNLTLTKTADAASVNAGSQIGFTVTLSNTGIGPATTVAINDPLPGGTGVSWSLSSAVTGWSITGTAPNQVLAFSSSSFAAGATTSVHVISSTTSASCATYPNTATVTLGNGTAPSPASASITVGCGTLGITKTPATQTVSAGTGFSWTVTLTNNGPGVASGAAISDPLPVLTGVSYTVGAGSAASCAITTGTLNCGPVDLAASGTLVAIINATTTAGTSCSTSGITNTATGSATGLSNVQASATTVIDCANIGITKTPTTQTISAGSPFSWTVTLTNTGDGTAVGASINDPLPTLTGVSYSLGAGSDASCAITAGTLTCGPVSLAKNATLVAVINATTTAGTSCSATGISNTATGSSTGLSNVQATATTIITCPNLSITKTPDQAGDAGYTVTVPGTATWTITVSNSSAAGTGSATGVVLTDTLPAGVTWTADNTTDCTSPIGTVTVNSVTRQRLICTIGTLAAGASFTVHVSGSVSSSILQQPDSPAGTPIEVQNDGDLVDGPAAGKDWATLGSTLLNCASNPKIGCDIDKPTGTTDDSFGQGTKEDSPVPTVVTGSIPNNKSDLLRFYVSTERFVQNNFLYLAWERVQAPNGTTNMDFELNQSSQLSANGKTPVRTGGDILIKYDLSRGGSQPTLGFHRWVTTGNPATVCEASNTVPCWGKGATVLTGGESAVNLVSVVDPIRAAGQTSDRTLDALTFGEASIDLQRSGIFQSNVCLNFGQAYLKSRSSDAFTSEIKDFIAPIPISVTNCAPALLNNKAWVSASNITGSQSDTGQIRVTE